MTDYDYNREARLHRIHQINEMLERVAPLGLTEGEVIALWGERRSLLSEEEATH